MYSFFQLLLRNCILGIVFSLIIVLFSIFTTSKFLQEKQSSHVSVIKANFNLLLKNKSQLDVNNSNEKMFIEVLQSNYQYTLLHIINKKAKNENIVNYSNPINSFILPFTLPKTNRVTLGDNLKIVYQLSFENESKVIIQMLLLILGLTFVFIFITSLLGSYSYKSLLATLCNDLKKAIETSFTNHEELHINSPLNLKKYLTNLKN